MTTYKILVIDDAFFIRNLIKKAVMRKPIKNDINFEIIGEAQNGNEGLKMAKELNPDIITVDFNIPELNGLDFAKYLKETNPKIPILMISSNTEPTFPQQVEEIGCHFLQKPFQESFLWMRLDALVEEINNFDENSIIPLISNETKELLQEINMEVEAELEEDEIEIEEIVLPKVKDTKPIVQNQNINSNQKKKKKKKKKNNNLFGLEIDDSIVIKPKSNENQSKSIPPTKVEKHQPIVKPIVEDVVSIIDENVKPIKNETSSKPIVDIDIIKQKEPIIDDKEIIIEDEPKTTIDDEEIIIEDEPKTTIDDEEIIIEDESETTIDDEEIIIEDESETTIDNEEIIIEDESETTIDDEEIIIEDEDAPLIIDDSGSDIIIIDDEEEIVIEIEEEEEDNDDVIEIEDDEEEEEDNNEDEDEDIIIDDFILNNKEKSKESINLDLTKEKLVENSSIELSEKDLLIKSLKENVNYSYQSEMAYVIHVMEKLELTKPQKISINEELEKMENKTPTSNLGIIDTPILREDDLTREEEDAEFDALFAEFNPGLNFSGTSYEEELRNEKSKEILLKDSPAITQKISIEPPKSEKVRQIYNKNSNEDIDQFVIPIDDKPQKVSIFTKIFNLFSGKK